MRKNWIMAVLFAAGTWLGAVAQTTPSQTTPSGNKKEKKTEKTEKKDTTDTRRMPAEKKDSLKRK